MSTPMRVVVAESVPARRAELVAAIEADGGIVVAGVATTAPEAVAAVLRERPDAAIVALELLEGGHQVSVARIMAEHAIPILVMSGPLEQCDAESVRTALAAGVADVRPRPAHWTTLDAAALRRRLHILSRVPMVTRRPAANGARPARPARTVRSIIALGASTGGPQALASVLGALRGIGVPIVCVQHIHPSFAEEFAPWLAQTSEIPVLLAEEGMALTPGAVHVAPAGRHMRVTDGQLLSLSESPDTIHRPSIDELFESVSRAAGGSAAAALLTGMGADGARGLLAIREAGGTTFAQDRETSAVYGMPAIAERLGAAQRILALDRIGPALRATFERVAA